MVGRDCGLGCKHANAIFATKTTLSTTLFVGCARRWSNISSSSTSWDDNENDDDRNDEIKSPGCLPIITSNTTTPKL